MAIEEERASSIYTYMSHTLPPCEGGVMREGELYEVSSGTIL